QLRFVEILGKKGGEGKTSLARQFLKALERDNYPHVDKVFGYSFAGRGAADFFDALLSWLGGSVPAANDLETGRGVARLLSPQRTLVILDGLEPLLAQVPASPDGPPTTRVIDLGLEAFLSELMNPDAAQARVLVTTRIGLGPFFR